MAEPPDDTLPMLGGKRDPSRYDSKQARERFAVAKYHGMGSDGEWTVAEIAEELDVNERTVYRYLNESDIATEVREILAVTEAEWRLDMALKLRREVERLEEIEQELLKRQKSVATDFETKTVEGTPTGDRNISLSDDAQSYRLKMPVPTDFEVVTDYGPDLEKVQKEKRQYLEQISGLLGLDAADKREVDHNLASKHEEVKIVEYRETEDPYPETEAVDMAEADPSAVENGPVQEAEIIDAEPVDKDGEDEP